MGDLTVCPSASAGADAVACMAGEGSAGVAGRLDTGDCTTTDCVPAAGALVIRTRSSPSEISSSPIPELSNSSISDLSLRRSIDVLSLGEETGLRGACVPEGGALRPKQI